MFLGMTESDYIGDRPFVIVGIRRRGLVELHKYWERVSFRQIVRMVHGAGSMICGCVAEAKSRSQQRKFKRSGRRS